MSILWVWARGSPGTGGRKMYGSMVFAATRKAEGAYRYERPAPKGAGLWAWLGWFFFG